MAEQAREFEVVLWGASGFTGQLTAEYLLSKYGDPADLRWAMAGRSQKKLERVREEVGQSLGVDPSGIPILVGDGGDEAFLRDLAHRTSVVCTTVGPYARYGSPLVAACVEAGTAYCDLTGEPHWMQAMIDAHQSAAEASGARIVFTCGFDCIPSDLGVFFLQQEMQARHQVACKQIQLRVKGFKGAASGGTIASMLTMLEDGAADRNAARAIRAPYALNPEGDRSGPDAAEGLAPTFDDDFGQWTAPFVMAAVNTKVVRRSNALLDYAYGRSFRYDEAMLVGRGAAGAARAAATSAASALTMGAMSVGPLRNLISGRLPQPGDGPTKKQQEEGYFDLQLRGVGEGGQILRARVRGDRDPGYGSTSKMLAESAICLAKDPASVGGGLWTPASAMGPALLKRMPGAGVTFEIEA